MQAIFEINANRRTPKYQQIINSVTKAIKEGKYKRGDRIFSINELCSEFYLSRDTVQRAYDMLERDSIIAAVRGKGFYINRTDIIHYRILLIFHKLGEYTKSIYEALVNTLGSKASVDLKILEGNEIPVQEVIDETSGRYDYYLIMPHFSENDIVEALGNGINAFKKYRRLICVRPSSSPYPPEIATGFTSFCTNHKLMHDVIPNVEAGDRLTRGEAYVVIEETDLANIIKNCRSQGLTIGKDIGILSYNDTPIKEMLMGGISVISADHQKMGESAAQMILEQQQGNIKNPFRLIMRKSL